MINHLFQPTAHSIRRYRRFAEMLFLTAVLHVPATAQNDHYDDLLACMVDSNKCNATAPKTRQRPAKKPGYGETASDAPLRPIPTYANNIDDRAIVSDCIINGMKGVSSDAAASMIRTACENRASALKRDRDLQNQREYGTSVAENAIEVTPSRRAGSVADRLVVSNVRGRPDAVITYVSFNVSSMTKGGQCYGEDMRLAYKMSLPSNSSVQLQIPAFYPAESPGVCAKIVEVKAKPSTWSDSMRSLTSIGEIAPLKVDPFP